METELNKDFEDNHFFLVFHLTSTEESSKSLTLYPELTRSSLVLKLYFSKALEDVMELFLIGERLSQIFIDSSRNVSKNTLIDGLYQLEKNCYAARLHATHFGGIWSSDIFPLTISP